MAIACIALLVVPALWTLTSQASYPAMTPRAPALERLTGRLVLVVVDGLRHDYATNPELAPSFARNMREHTSATVWAGQVTMTSAAALSFGTGTRGSFTQVVLNVDARRTTANHLFENAKAAGLRIGVIGDPVWHQAYGDFDFERLSPGDLAMSFDDSPELFGVAHGLIERGELPELLVLHFFASDHLQHHYGVFSPQFREFFLKFDANLQRFLDALPKDTTVVALSDHGALSNGNHGVDSDLERKTPLFAYGPGIARGQKLVLEQVDVAPTLAALLGVRSPSHGVGMPVVELLDAEPAKLSKLACAESDRIAELGRKVAGGGRGPASRACSDVAAARATARAWDREIAAVPERFGAMGFAGTLLVLVLFGAAVPLLLGLGRAAHAVRGAAALALTAGTCVGVTAFVDWTLPPYNDARAVIGWVTVGLLGAALLSPRLAERTYNRFPFLALALAPGFLVASFPTNTQLQSGVVTALCLVGVALAARRAGASARELALPLGAGAVGGALALRLATVRDDPLEMLAGSAGLGAGAALIAIWLAVAAALSRERRAKEVAGAIALAVGAAVLPRAWIPAGLGLALLVVLPIIAVVLWRRGFGLLSRGALFAAYALVSRPMELAAVAGLALAAEAVGALLVRRVRTEPSVVWSVIVATTAVFVLGYGVRLGVQRGLDFVMMDWGAGGFDSKNVPASRITAALVVKYGAALALPGVALLSRLPADVWWPALRLLSAAMILRLATMGAILFAPWVSFWSRFRMLGELGPMAVGAVVAAVSLIAIQRVRVRSREPDLVVSPSRS